MKKKTLHVAAVLILSAPFVASHAAIVAVDCTKKGASVNGALAKLDRSLSNTVNINGSCTENVVVDGHRDLSLVAVGTVSLSALASNTATVRVIGSSRVNLSGFTINGGSVGVECDDRSVCVLRSVNIVGGSSGGLSLQKQSSVDVFDGSIINSGGTGVGVYGASSVNIRSEASPNPVVISGHSTGIFAQDGSFVRVDGATISGNGSGAFGDRGAVLKLLGTTITGNTYQGVIVRASTLQLLGSVTNNGWHGVEVRRLGYVVFAGNTDLTGNTGQSVQCDHVTSVTQPQNLVGQSFLTFDAIPKTTCPSNAL